MIATYALCGFSNFASLGIAIGAMCECYFWNDNNGTNKAKQSNKQTKQTKQTTKQNLQEN